MAAIALGQDVDTTPPQLVDFTFAPTAIDVSAGPQTVSATLHVTDDLSGTSLVDVGFVSPSGQFQSIICALVAGDSLDGTFQGALSFPQFSENGTWTVTGVNLFDLASNHAFFDAPVLQARGFPTELTVFSDPTDVTGPTVTGIGIFPSAVDVSAGAQDITFRLDVTDDLSGAIFTPGPTGSFFGFFPVQFGSPSAEQRRFIANQQFTLISGTSLNGTWEATFSMPQFSEPGTWRIEFLQLRDVAANQTFLGTDDLTALGLPVDFDVFSDPADTTPPDLTGLNFEPSVINTSSGFQLVTVRLDVADDLAGADFSETTQFLSFFEAGVQFTSPSGQQGRACAAVHSISWPALQWMGHGKQLCSSPSSARTEPGEST